MPVQGASQRYEQGLDADAWQSGVSNAGGDWADGLSGAGQEWANGIQDADWAGAIEADDATSGSVPEEIVSKWRTNSQNAQNEFANSGTQEAQNRYESGATDSAAQDYRNNANGQAWEDGYTDLSSWGS